MGYHNEAIGNVSVPGNVIKRSEQLPFPQLARCPGRFVFIQAQLQVVGTSSALHSQHIADKASSEAQTPWMVERTLPSGEGRDRKSGV